MARRKKKSSDVNRLIDQLAESEVDFLKAQFIAPALPGGIVRVKIGDAICKIRTAPEDFAGIGLFEPISITEAILVREASLSERRQYLDLFPKLGLIVCQRRRGAWHACPANEGDTRFRIEGVVPLELAVEVQLFDSVIARYDGTRFWFDEIDMRVDPRFAPQLRRALDEREEPASVTLSGMISGQRTAYEYGYWQLVAPRARRTPASHRNPESVDADPVQSRLRESLSHAGANLISYVERNDSFHVAFSLDGRTYNSAINKENLTVFSSGICLDGQDRDFDLTSLVGVLRVGQRGVEFG